MRRASTRAIWVVIVAMAAGCSYTASRVEPVEIDPSDASSAAIEQYDKDGDGALGEAELAAVPGIKKHLDRYDRDGDGQVSREEIRQRLEAWSNERLALLGASVVVFLDGQPLDGATVTFVPEEYLGPNVKPATGVTTPTGLTRLSHAEEFLPKTANGRPMYGVTSGTFKVEITHPSRNIPARYNTATELGEEIAYDLNPSGDVIKLSLTSN